MRRLAICSGFILSVICLCVLAGCGPGGPTRYEVSGTVLYKGQGLDEGIITFMPLDNQGTQDGATILNGEYRIPRNKGLFPGRYKVIIIGGDGTSGGGQADPGKPGLRPGATPGKERIPPKYNEKSEVIREVTPEGPNRFDFNIS